MGRSDLGRYNLGAHKPDAVWHVCYEREDKAYNPAFSMRRLVSKLLF